MLVLNSGIQYILETLLLVKLEAGGPTTGWIYGFRIGTSGDTIISNSLAPIGDAASTTFNPFNTDINTVRGTRDWLCYLESSFP